MRAMITRRCRSRMMLAATVGSAVACGAASPAPATPLAAPAERVVSDGAAVDPVRPGRYRLEMSATCDEREAQATGTLELAPISGGSGAPPEGGDPATSGEGALLWGQTDLDVARLASCLGPAGAPSGDPIHPGVLVEVLRWDGGSQRQVLLVSTEGARPAAGRSGGVALWVERAAAGRLGGVWSRWELMGREEGRWSAERLPDVPVGPR